MKIIGEIAQLDISGSIVEGGYSIPTTSLGAEDGTYIPAEDGTYIPIEG